MIPLNLMEAIFDVPEEYLCKFTSMRQHRENQPSLKAHNLINTDHALAILTIPKFKYSVPWYPHIYDNTALVLPFSSILVLGVLPREWGKCCQNSTYKLSMPIEILVD